MTNPHPHPVYYTFVHVHFFFALVMSDIMVSVRHARKGKWFMFAQEMGIIFLFYLPSFWVLLKFRKRLAALPPKELSNYLVEYVVKAGLAAILSMLFLSFETMSCLSDMGYGADEGIDTCVSVSLCQQYLSYYLFVALALRLFSKTVAFKVRTLVELKLHHIATFKGMNFRQRVQSLLTMLAGTCSIFLVSHLGARLPSKSSEDFLFYVGAVGALAATLALVLEVRSDEVGIVATPKFN